MRRPSSTTVSIVLTVLFIVGVPFLVGYIGGYLLGYAEGAAQYAK